jgi:hypothetical protein
VPIPRKALILHGPVSGEQIISDRSFTIFSGRVRTRERNSSTRFPSAALRTAARIRTGLSFWHADDSPGSDPSGGEPTAYAIAEVIWPNAYMGHCLSRRCYAERARITPSPGFYITYPGFA